MALREVRIREGRGRDKEEMAKRGRSLKQLKTREGSSEYNQPVGPTYRGMERRRMPIHDWTRVEAGTFHDFHQGWTIEIRNKLNSGVLPDGYFAMADQRVSGPEPDVVALKLRGPSSAGRTSRSWTGKHSPDGSTPRADALGRPATMSASTGP